MRKFLIAAITTIVSFNATALSSGSIVFDPSNFVKNSITAGAEVENLIQTTATALTTYKQLKEMYRMAQATLGGDLTSLGAITNQKELVKQIQDTQNMMKSLQDLNKNLSNVQGRSEYLTSLADKYGMSLSDYLKNREKIASEGVKSAQIERDQDLASLKKIENSYRTVQEMESRISATDTNTNLLINVNKEMNAVLASINNTNDILVRQKMRGEEEKVAAASEAQANEKYAQDAVSDRQRVSAEGDARIKANMQRAVDSLK